MTSWYDLTLTKGRLLPGDDGSAAGLPAVDVAVPYTSAVAVAADAGQSVAV